MSASTANGTIGLLQGHALGSFGDLITMPNNGNDAGGHDTFAHDSALHQFPVLPHKHQSHAGTATNILGGIISIDAISIAGGNNTLNGGNTANTWTINNHNAGILNGVSFGLPKSAGWFKHRSVQFHERGRK